MNVPCSACGSVPPRSPCVAVLTHTGTQAALCSACRWIARPGVPPWRLIAVGQVLMGAPVTVEVPSREVRSIEAHIGRRRPNPLIVADFIREACKPREGAVVANGDAWGAYVQHAHATGRQPLSRMAWARGMREAGHPSEKVSGYMVVRGLVIGGTLQANIGGHF